MPRRRAGTTAAVACGLALVVTAPTCSHALVAPRHGLARACAVTGRRRRWAPALRRRGGGDDDDDDDDEEEEDEEEDEEDDEGALPLYRPHGQFAERVVIVGAGRGPPPGWCAATRRRRMA